MTRVVKAIDIIRYAIICFLCLSAPSVEAYIPDSYTDMAYDYHKRIDTHIIKIVSETRFEKEPVYFVQLESAVTTDGTLTSEGPPVSADDEDEFEDFEADLEDEFGDQSEMDVFDPLSGYNRFMTHVNDKLYFWVLKPVANGYKKVVPEGGRRSIVRFFNNLLFPVRFVNNFLQLKFKCVGSEMARFTVNSTLGILGFGDPAKRWFDLDPCPEDFGQTLGHYGVGSGFHIVLPILGPSNLRDTLGLVPDYFLDPVNHIEGTETEIAVEAYDKMNETSLHLGEYETFKKDALDLYLFIRDTYEQYREEKIKE